MRKLQNGMLYSKNELMHFIGNVLILLLCVDSQCLSYYMSEHMKILHTFFSMHMVDVMKIMVTAFKRPHALLHSVPPTLQQAPADSRLC